MRIAEDLFKLETQASGEVLVTNLLALAYPFIRFRLGDLMEIADPPNDRLPYAVITKVVGRTVDLIPVKAGGYVHGVALAHVIDPHLRFVKKYQVHQLTFDHFKVKLIADGDIPESVPQQIATDLRSLVGADTRVDVECVDDIPPAPSGKFRWVISDISDIARTRVGRGSRQGGDGHLRFALSLRPERLRPRGIEKPLRPQLERNRYPQLLIDRAPQRSPRCPTND